MESIAGVEPAHFCFAGRSQGRLHYGLRCTPLAMLQLPSGLQPDALLSELEVHGRVGRSRTFVSEATTRRVAATLLRYVLHHGRHYKVSGSRARRKVKESNSQLVSWHSFQDCLSPWTPRSVWPVATLVDSTGGFYCLAYLLKVGTNIALSRGIVGLETRFTPRS